MVIPNIACYFTIVCALLELSGSLIIGKNYMSGGDVLIGAQPKSYLLQNCPGWVIGSKRSSLMKTIHHPSCLYTERSDQIACVRSKMENSKFSCKSDIHLASSITEWLKLSVISARRKERVGNLTFVDLPNANV